MRFARPGVAIPMLLIASGCSDGEFEARMKAMSGNDYLALSTADKAAFVDQSIARYTTWRFWDRPDLCPYVLEPDILAALYESSAEKAQSSPLAFTFVIDANDVCIAQGQVFK